ncbi:STAS domain-containing protein [Amycolatopsis sp. NPDC004378]
MRRWEAWAEPADGSPRRQVIVVRGGIDDTVATAFERRLRELAGSGPADVVVDLSATSLVSAAAVRAIARTATGWRAHHRRTRVVISPGSPAGRVVPLVTSLGLIAVHDSRGAALAANGQAVLRPAQTPRAGTMAELVQAVQQLQRRYSLSDIETAVGLLRDAATRHRIHAGQLAAAAAGELLVPATRSAVPDGAPPAMPFPVRASPAPKLLTVLDAALKATMNVMGAPAGYAQVATANALLLVGGHGLDRELWRTLGRIGRFDTACARASLYGTRVVVPDLSTDTLLTGTRTREVLLADRFRFAQSTPVLDHDSLECRAVLSTLDRRSGRVVTAAEATELDRIAHSVSRWEAWDDRRRLRAALRDLHDTLAAG